ncbi:interferon-induced very large GTPase 1-like isoform X2 [Hypomesus transpacificus]|uniref:interferon-induced very large GTPase 1-like isoform X2 n=1 Tax=Hypomesus transpacificus TaxID=137520 RepID=UPI001F084FB7|nr:interferon-induced very large GTPase 1-like isoform X2 [Hypomesus transpacificus]
MLVWTAKKSHSFFGVDYQATEIINNESEFSDPQATPTGTPELTVVLIGDTGSVEMNSQNLLLTHDRQLTPMAAAGCSHTALRLYDLCGRHVSIINMLGLQTTERVDQVSLESYLGQVAHEQGIHAFLLLSTLSQHIDSLRRGAQWLKRKLGEKSLAFVIPVFTCDNQQDCISVLDELRAHSDLKHLIETCRDRYHTCQRGMNDPLEMESLLDKINLMVSETPPGCYSGEMFDEVSRQTTEQEERDESGDMNEEAVDISDKGKETPQMEDTSGDMVDSEKERLANIETLMDRLQLQHKHEYKLTTADFLNIGPSSKHQHETKSEKDLAHTFLQKLFLLDYRARYIPVKKDESEMKSINHTLTADRDTNVYDALFSEREQSDSTDKHSHVHPIDVQMAVFHCSDSFLRQYMVTKLSACQYALPLLVPDLFTQEIEFPLWTFRQIGKSWKSTSKLNGITSKSMPIYKAQTPMIAFFRLGSVSSSKSQLMNNLINQRHSTFFHRDCPGSTKTRILMDGVAEIAWYYPAGKTDDAFTDCVAFCNLRGDAVVHEKQRDFLTEYSSVNVVLLPSLGKDDKRVAIVQDLVMSPKPLICLLTDDDFVASEFKPGKYRIGLRDRNQSEVSEELTDIIRKTLSPLFLTFNLEEVAKQSGFRLDENDHVCQTGKNAALEIKDLLKVKALSEIKDTFLPCQDRLWHDWCRKNKDLYRLQGNVEMEKSKKHNELNKIRYQQQDVSFSELMKLFLTNLRSLGSEERKYFLKWIMILLDDLSTNELSELHHRYDEKWSEVLALKKKHDKSVQLKKKQLELEEISEKLQSATVGFEHIWREVGQIYEAHVSVPRGRIADINFSYLPEMAADLMISGHPMELMDGDAGHVPLTWIKSVLDEVIRKVNDPRVFVLSILGIQSTGKSTMLNAMFGLQFAVSAGRCTRGAFMQLVRLTKEMKKDFPFDYVLVIDTEGLRALELAGKATVHHDNELATFVIGLGNMTVINIFGENPAEMQDILQIAVQAFMRMKKVRFSPSCVFVHQNVGDITAGEKNMEGKRRLQEKLDEMTQLAAKEEGCDAECFSEIITFDIKRDVKYFSQLWEGSPPMAPPNPRYSENVQELKNMILSKTSKSTVMKLSAFQTRVEDLWNALLNENFVFSFKNTLEIAVYRKLEVQYRKWTWALRSAMLTIENQLHNRIENGELHKVDQSYLVAKMRKTCDKVQEAMKKHFEEETDKDILVQWQGRFECKIGELREELVRGSKKKLEEVIQQREARHKLDEKNKLYEDKLFQKSKEVALKLKDEAMDEDQLQKEFSSVWEEWVVELTKDTPAIKDIDIAERIIHVLVEIGNEPALVHERKTSKSYLDLCKLGNYSEYIFFPKEEIKMEKEHRPSYKTSLWGTFKTLLGINSSRNKTMENQNHLTYSEGEQLTTFIEDVVKETKNMIEEAPTATRGYHDSYLPNIAVHVQTRVEDFHSKKKNYALKKTFTVDLLLRACEHAEHFLSKSYREFKNNNDALTYLGRKKTQYYMIFKRFYEGATSVIVLGEMICNQLKASMVQAIYDKTAIDLAEEMQSSYPPFSGNRSNLEKHILMSLAEKENFDSYITYIKSPKIHFESFIRETVNKYIFSENNVKTLSIIKDNIKSKERCVNQAVHRATETVKTNQGDRRMWLKEFSNHLKDELKFENNRYEDLDAINEFDLLEEVVKESLKSKVEEINQGFSDVSLLKMENFRERPDDILIKHFCDCCWVQCPFCKAICTNTMSEHQGVDHSVSFHRPDGLAGWHFEGTVQLCTSFCTSSVASDGNFLPNYDSDESIPFKQYRTGGPRYADWSITSDLSELPYWKWFVCRFQKDLENYYGKKFQGWGEIPNEWRTNTRDQAIESLNKI